MRNILVTQPLPSGGLDALIDAGYSITQGELGSVLDHDAVLSMAVDHDGIICLLTDRIDEAVLRAGAKGKLKVVANAAVGFDNIDVKAASKLGISVCNTPGVLDQTTADLAFLLILAAGRQSSQAERDLREGKWTGWGISDHLGRDIYGSVLGLVGHGRIAREVARRAAGFGMEVLHYSRTNTGLPGYVSTLDELLTTVDIVSLHVPLTPETHHLIGSHELSMMKPTATLINTARGSVVDEEALITALEEGVIYAAGLDVFDNEPHISKRLLNAPRTVLLPHIGSATIETRTRMAKLASQGVLDVLEGRTPANLVLATSV